MIEYVDSRQDSELIYLSWVLLLILLIIHHHSACSFWVLCPLTSVFIRPRAQAERDEVEEHAGGVQ